VRLSGIAALVNRGEDPCVWIAKRLNEVEASEGREKVERALSSTLEL
jgi:hypothetical protein